MGLSKGARDWLLPAGMLLAAALLAAGGDAARIPLRYDRDAVSAGELWRLLSGHFVHLGGTHLLLNLAGLVLVWILVGGEYRARGWLVIAAASIAAIDLGFWFLEPELLWYVGLSGLLHGLLAAGAIGLASSQPLEAALIGGLVTVKLLWEQFAGPLPGSETVSGGQVITAAHLYGAIGGGLAAALIVFRARKAARPGTASRP